MQQHMKTSKFLLQRYLIASHPELRAISMLLNKSIVSNRQATMLTMNNRSANKIVQQSLRSFSLPAH